MAAAWKEEKLPFALPLGALIVLHVVVNIATIQHFKGDIPNHSQTTVSRELAEEVDGYWTVSLRVGIYQVTLLTSCSIGDIDGECCTGSDA